MPQLRRASTSCASKVSRASKAKPSWANGRAQLLNEQELRCKEHRWLLANAPAVSACFDEVRGGGLKTLDFAQWAAKRLPGETQTTQPGQLQPAANCELAPGSLQKNMHYFDPNRSEVLVEEKVLLMRRASCRAGHGMSHLSLALCRAPPVFIEPGWLDS